MRISQNVGNGGNVVRVSFNRNVIAEYVRLMTNRGLAFSTVSGRQMRLEALPQRIEDCTANDILSVIPLYLKASSRLTYLAQLQYACRDMLAAGLITRDPTVGITVVKPPRRLPRPLTPSEQTVLLGMEGRARAWTILGQFAGFRASDVVRTEFAHLEEREYGPVLRVPHGKGGLDATLPAHPRIIEALSPYVNTTGPIWPLLPATMSKAWAADAKAVGVKARFHQNRHTYATRMYQSTHDIAIVSKLMRHASVATTMIYTEIGNEEQFAAVMGL